MPTMYYYECTTLPENTMVPLVFCFDNVCYADAFSFVLTGDEPVR